MSRKELTRGEAKNVLLAILGGGLATLACAEGGAIMQALTPTAENHQQTPGMQFVKDAAQAVFGENTHYLDYLHAGDMVGGRQQIDNWYLVLDAGDSVEKAQWFLNILRGASNITPDGTISPEDLRQSRTNLEPWWNLTVTGGLRYPDSGNPADRVHIAIKGRFTETDVYGLPTSKELHVIDTAFNPVSYAAIESGANMTMFDGAVLAIQP
jgi:hypothetical protein